MTNEEAINVLQNTAWLGTEKDREEVEKAVELAVEALKVQLSKEDSMKFEVPENCGSCLSIGQFGNKYICGMPVSKEKEMLDISAFEVDINSRPDWCPKNKVLNIINNLSEENKVLVDRMYDGFSAMVELMNKSEG